MWRRVVAWSLLMFQWNVLQSSNLIRKLADFSEILVTITRIHGITSDKTHFTPVYFPVLMSEPQTRLEFTPVGSTKRNQRVHLSCRSSVKELAAHWDVMTATERTATLPVIFIAYERRLHLQKADPKMINNLRDPATIYPPFLSNKIWDPSTVTGKSRYNKTLNVSWVWVKYSKCQTLSTWL